MQRAESQEANKQTDRLPLQDSNNSDNKFKVQLYRHNRQMSRLVRLLALQLLLLIAGLALVGADIEEVTLSPQAQDETTPSDNLTPPRPERLTVIAPKKLRPHSDFHVVVSLAESEQPASVELQLTGGRDSSQEHSEAKSVLVASGETQSVKFEIGDWPAAEYVLNMTAEAVDRSWNYSQEAVLVFEQRTYVGLVQTDKAIYKPGQQVKLRCLFLKQTLQPLVLRDEINVTITDPKRNIVKQWQALSNYRGLLSLELDLSDEPMLGDWTIQAEARSQTTTKRFQVAEYILPTFEVGLQLPKFITYDEPELIATVRATYTYGKPVNGQVTLTVQPLVRFANLDTRPLQQAQFRSKLINGSTDIEVDVVKELKQTRELFEREIEFFALVEEDLTGRKYNKTQVIKIFDKSVKIEQLNGHNTFKPGLSHLIQLKVAYQDDTPVEDNGPELELKLNFLGQTFEVAKLKPVGGLAQHQIDVPRNITRPNWQGRFVEPSMIDMVAQYRGQKHYLAPMFAYKSQSGQYMQISLPQIAGSVRYLAPSGESRRQTASSSARVNEDLRVQVRATEPMQQVSCQGVARGDIVWALSRSAKNATSFEFDVQVDPRMAPEARIICYYIRSENKEIIADATSVQVSGLNRNPVKLSLSRDEAKPGQEVELSVLTKPSALVGVLAIDQSVLLLKSGNDISQQEIGAELRHFGSPDWSAASHWMRASNAERLFDMSDVVVLTNNRIYDGDHELYSGGGGFASRRLSGSAPAPTSSVVLSARVLESAELQPPEFHLDNKKSGKSGEPLIIRSVFPETWLWQNATANQAGGAQFRAKVPDSITSWTLSAFSISEDSGLGLSAPGKTSLRVFRPFFVKLNLPYSIIRGEVVSVQAIVFNYAKRATSARVTLENKHADFEFVEAANDIGEEEANTGDSEQRSIANIKPDGGTAAVSFLIRPLKLGHIDIRLVARGELAADGLVRKLLVKPEGQVQHFNKATLIDLPAATGGTASRNVSIEVPPNAVAGSQQVSVSAVGDILGAGLSNVDDLLRLPYGCGEQNMINLVPNIVMLNYLQSSRRLKETQRTRAIRNIEVGYQRQLNYKRHDGSFSAFGNNDKNGSVWLTAYVLKTLRQASSLIRVDERVLSQAAAYIARFARSDGTIEELGMVHNKRLQSQANEDSSSSSASASMGKIYLTAYAMVALLQRQDDNSAAFVAQPIDEVLQRGLDYLERQLNSGALDQNNYGLAIIAYTMQLANSNNNNNRQQAADTAYEKLWSRATDDPDRGTWWQPETEPQAGNKLERESGTVVELPNPSSKPPPLTATPVNAKHSAHLFVPDSLAIEITALGLLTSVRRADLQRALPLVRWLIEQQNSNGGFASTQDTVLAIEALASFAAASQSSQSPPTLDIEFLYPRQQAAAAAATSGRLAAPIRRNNVDQIQISPSNALVSQQTRLPNNISWVQVQASGSGAAVVQVSWQYNLLVSAEQPAFYLNPIIDRTSNINYLQLSICTYYKAGDQSNMAIVEIELPSGYVADAEALPSLRRTKDIMRTETLNGDTKIVVYLDKVTREELCFTVPAYRTSKVSNNKPVPVAIYDYYNRQQAARIFYEPQPASSCDICEQDSCSNKCRLQQGQAKKSDKLVSLHEQRKVKVNTSGQNQRFGNITSSVEGKTNARPSYYILPLAPLLMTIVALVTSTR